MSDTLQTYPLPADPDLPPRSCGRSPIFAGMAKTFELHVVEQTPSAKVPALKGSS